MLNSALDTDEALVERMAAGDSESLARLYDRHRRLVFSLACRILGHHAEAEEVLLDVFHQAWRGAAGFDRRRGAVPAWLVTLCRSRAIDRRRAGARRIALADAVSQEERVAAPPHRPGGSGPDEQAEAGVKRRLIGQALATLPASQRAAIEMAYYDGLSHSEIAARLEEPLGTVKTRIRQGLLSLRRSLSAHFEQ